MSYCFGVDIGGTTIKMGFFSRAEGLLEKWEIPTPKGKDPIPLLHGVAVSVEACLSKRGLEKAEIAGIGMTAPGPVTEDGLLHSTVNIGWGDVYLGKEAEKIIGISPVIVGNDATIAALGEFRFGAGIGVDSMLMITLGTGVGGGVILKREVINGVDGIAGEIGHTTINPFETETCSCGKKGCTEQYASATGMVRVAKQFLQNSPMDSILRKAEPITAKDIWDGAKAGDALAEEITDFVSSLLGMSLANACCVIDPERIVLGGGVSGAGEYLLNKVKREFSKNVFAHCKNRTFCLAKLKNDAGIYGGAALVFGE